MRSTITFLVLLTSTFFVSAQEPIEDGEIVMINPKHPSEECENIFKNVAKPSFPTSLSAQHTVAKSGACSVTLSFTVLKSGRLKSYEIDTVEKRCKPFIRSSVIALKNSSFQEQDIVKHCYHTYTYEFE